MTVVRPSNEEVYLVALKRIANMDGHNISTTARAIAKQAIASAPETPQPAAPTDNVINDIGADNNTQPATSNPKLYANRDHYQLSPEYERHLLAMTAESLNSKSAIAAELAQRDIEIERLRRNLNLRNEQIDGYERQLDIDQAGAEQTIGSEIERLRNRLDKFRGLPEHWIALDGEDGEPLDPSYMRRATPETRPTRDVEHCDYPDCERHWTAVVAQARELLEPLAEHDPEIRKWLRTAGLRQVGCEDANRLLRIHTETCDVCLTEKVSEPLPCEHLRSERLGTKSSPDGDPLFEMRRCLDCTKIFRVRLAQNGDEQR